VRKYLFLSHLFCSARLYSIRSYLFFIQPNFACSHSTTVLASNGYIPGVLLHSGKHRTRFAVASGGFACRLYLPSGCLFQLFCICRSYSSWWLSWDDMDVSEFNAGKARLLAAHFLPLNQIHGGLIHGGLIFSLLYASFVALQTVVTA
jgi:hypothetical protein